MKQINVWFEDEEHEEILKVKDEENLNWRDFILKLVRELKLKKEMEK